MFAVFESITGWLWGLPLLITILVTGIYLTVRTGFFQFRHFGYIVKNMFSKESRTGGGDDGKNLTPFQAISVAIGGTVGVSNMSGVATAIATGGPGALFWLAILFAGKLFADKSYRTLAVFVPNAAIMATLFVATPAYNEFRYAYSLILTLPLFFAAAFCHDAPCGTAAQTEQCSPR